MSIKPLKILEIIYLHPNIMEDQCELPNGQMITPHLLAYDELMIFALTKKEEVLLVEQYRHGVQQAIVELPGGSVDDGESPLEAARRELLEETGSASETWIEVGCASPNPAIYTNKISSFLAMDVQKVGDQSLEDAENIEVVLSPIDEVITMAKRGELIHSLDISTLFFVLARLPLIQKRSKKRTTFSV